MILSALGQRLPSLCRHGCRNVNGALRTIDLTGLSLARSRVPAVW